MKKFQNGINKNELIQTNIATLSGQGSLLSTGWTKRALSKEFYQASCGIGAKLKEISDTEIFKQLGILKAMRELAKTRNFTHLWRGFCELGIEYLELLDHYKQLVKRVQKAIEVDAAATYPVALPNLWGQKSQIKDNRKGERLKLK